MKYYKQLDGLRFVAVFLVLIHHFATTFGKYVSAGYYGVDLFFVISGYLITGILLRTGERFPVAYKKFMGRRILRIFPLYYLTLFIVWLLNYEYARRYLFYCLTYTYNYAIGYFNLPDNYIGHFWSLCIEEQFYLVWPFIVLALRKNAKVLKLVIVALLAICSLQLYFNIFPALTPYNRLALIPQANSLSIGALGVILIREKKIPLKILETKWIEYAVFFVLFFFLYTDYKIKLTICPLASLFLIFKTTHKGFLISPLNNFLKNNIIVYIGTISYGIYVFHYPLSYYLNTYFVDPFLDRISFESLGRFASIKGHSGLIKFPLYTGLSILLAHLSYKYFEKPILSLKDRYFKYKQKESRKILTHPVE